VSLLALLGAKAGSAVDPFPPPGGTEKINETFTYADQTGWTGWTTWIALGSGGDTGTTATVVSNAGRLAGGGGSYRGTAAGRAVSALDIDFRFRFRMNQTAESYMGVTWRHTSALGSGIPRIGYRVVTTGQNDELSLEEYNNSNVGTTIAAVNTALPVDTSWRWLRVRNVGSSIKVKCWADGDPEPGAWAIDVTNSTYSTAGSFSLFGQNGNATTVRSVDFDDIEVYEL
jgi:hypothetical protein